MTAHETAGSCIAAAVAILLVAPAAFDVWHKRRTRRRFQTTARQAARTDATVAEDAAAKKATRKQNEANEDMATCLAIWDITPHDIPHQTRRTEEDQ